MRDLEIPGVAAAIVQAGRVAFAGGFGVASLQAERSVTPETRFAIGSTTKALTTLMMARLIEAGAFEWSTPVTALLPGFALADAETTAKLQLHHTVSAGTGMPRRDMDMIFKYAGVSAADRIAEMKEMPPTTGFGETFQYSNYLVAAGGYAAARGFAADGTLESAYDRAMRSTVFGPLAMTKTTLSPVRDADEAAPHAAGFDGHVVALDPAIEEAIDSVAPAGSARSTATDLARYVMLELGGGTMPDGTEVVPRAALLRRRERRTKIDGKSAYGLGLFITEELGVEVFSHGGNTMGFSSDLYFVPSKGFGAVVLTNVQGANAFLAAVRQRVFELVLGAPEKSEQMIAGIVKSTKSAVAARGARIARGEAATAWIAEWIGSYACKQLGGARIERNGDGYRVEFDSWGSGLGTEESGGEPLMVLTSPPWIGLRLQPDAATRTLTIDAAQTKYVFEPAHPHAGSGRGRT